MTAAVVTDWIPEENSSDVIQRVTATSAVEALARKEGMTSLTKSVPRALGVTSEVVAKSAAYTEDSSANDDVVLTARKFGLAVRIAEEDMGDTLVSTLDVKRLDWATAYARHLDNACLSTDTVTDGAGLPFNSVYYELTQNGRAGTGYSANDNVTTAATATAPTYAQLNTVCGLYEVGDYYDEGRSFIVAHPGWKEQLRGVLDSQSRPIFISGTAGAPDSLFGYAITWALGAREPAVASGSDATPSPVGAQHLLVGNRDHLILGVRSGPESKMSGGDAVFLNDEVLLKMRSRRGFRVGEVRAFSLLRNVA